VSGLGKVKGRLVVLLDMNKLLAPGSLLSAERTKKSKPAVKGEARGASAS
jgi:hypothetical protein